MENLHAGLLLYFVGIANALVGFKLIEPFYLATGVASQAEMDQAYAQMDHEMQQPDFAAVQYYLSAWGTKVIDGGATG